jgi:NADH-quinone oxidoreductase subunit J
MTRNRALSLCIAATSGLKARELSRAPESHCRSGRSQPSNARRSLANPGRAFRRPGRSDDRTKAQQTLMSIAEIAFFLFAAAAIGSGLMVISSRNPVHSVLFLICAFISTAGLFVLMGAEYLAMLLLVVYVGAVAVLFLFVVMMLDVDFVELKQGFLRYMPLGGAIAAIVVVELIMVAAVWVFPSEEDLKRAHPVPTGPETVTHPIGPNNIEAIGSILYTDYVHYFQIAGIVLLIAMIGAIVLTFRVRTGVRKQDAWAQIGRKREEGVELVKVKTGQGI